MTMAPVRVGATWRVTAHVDRGEVQWVLYACDPGEDGSAWRHVTDRVTAIPPNGYYEDGALSWLRQRGIDPNLAHVALALPDGDEWIRPAR